jgi:endonuclease III
MPAVSRHVEPKRTAQILLARYGQTFAEELGLALESNRSPALFCLLIAALLFSARIGHSVALESARILFRRGWTTPRKLAATTWNQRVQALDEGGYVRYDERTSTMLGETAQMLIELYGGDLRKLREQADSNPAIERKLLKQFKGVGDVGVNIFFREAQVVWPELFPFADEKVLACAKRLHLPADPELLRGLVRGRRDFARLVAALMRVQLDKKHNEILSESRR